LYWSGSSTSSPLIAFLSAVGHVLGLVARPVLQVLGRLVLLLHLLHLLLRLLARLGGLLGLLLRGGIGAVAGPLGILTLVVARLGVFLAHRLSCA
jgi:hypothetical protein